VAGADRGAEERRDGAPSARHGHAFAALGDPSEHDHAARLDVARTELVLPGRLCVRSRPVRADEPDELRAATLALRDLLKELGLATWVKTSGSKGFHILVALDGSARMGEVARFAHAVGALLVKRQPDRFTQEFSKSDRGGRLYVDTGRNGYSATFAAAYTVRAKQGAPVSAPCTWEEIERGDVGPRTFTLRTMTDRVAKAGDLWAHLHKHRSSLRQPIERLRKLSQAYDGAR